MKFIKLTGIDNRARFLAANKIVCIAPGLVFVVGNGTPFTVAESPEEVLRKIHLSGKPKGYKPSDSADYFPR